MQKRKAIHVRISDRNFEQLQTIRERFGCLSDSEAIRRALSYASQKRIRRRFE